tara:strand:+ start:68 stop:322 length:255 start_codon:yes stop_codon:yes gene_type:complete
MAINRKPTVDQPEEEKPYCHICGCWECGGNEFVDYGGGYREDCDCIYYGDHISEAENCRQNEHRTIFNTDDFLRMLARLSEEEE